VEKASGGYLQIEDAKTLAGWRQVPVHSKFKATLKRLLKDSRDGYVLSGLQANKYGDRSNAVGKRFGRLKASLSFGPEHVFHSVRRTVAILLENAGAEGVAADIIGHEKTTMTYGLYSGDATLDVKREAIERLPY
jgi:integrase